MPARVLLAVDLYDLPADLLPQAVSWATRLNARLDLFYAGRYETYTRFVHDPAVRRLLDAEAHKARDADRATLNKILSEVPEDCRGEAVLVDGDAVEGLLEAEAPYDAVLVGTHGRTGLARALLGSTAERIVRTSIRPVLVLRLTPPE